MDGNSLAIVAGISLQLFAQVLGYLPVEVSNLAREVHLPIQAGQLLLQGQASIFFWKQFSVKLQDVLVLFIWYILDFQIQLLNPTVELGIFLLQGRFLCLQTVCSSCQHCDLCRFCPRLCGSGLLLAIGTWRVTV